MVAFRRWVPILITCCLFVIAGCLGGPIVGDPGETETAERSGTDARETEDRSGTDVSDEGAAERALAAEEDYLTDRLSSASCVGDWGLTAYGGIDENATVTNRTADGVHVSVSHPYWYGAGQYEVDGGSMALYLVTADDVRRVRGDDVSPC